MPTYTNQHTISACLLKRFANDRGHVGVLTKAGQKHRSHYRSEARIKKFLGEDEQARLRLESEVFGSVEAVMPAAFTAVSDGTVFDQPEIVSTLLRFIAIHLIRSTSADKQWRGLWQTYQHNRPLLRSVPNHDPAVIKIRTQALTNVLDKIVNDLMNGAWIEIGVAAEGTSFILADTGTFIMDSGSGKMGLHNEVGFKAADALILPLGPKYIAAVCTGKAPPPQYRELSEGSVRRFNEFQLNAAVDKVYFQL